MKKIRKILAIILTVELLLLGFNYFHFNSAKVVRAFGPINVTFPSSPLFQEANWIPGSNAAGSFTVENTDLFPHKIGINAVNISDSTQLSGEISIVVLTNDIPVYGEGSDTGVRHLSDFYKESSVWLSTVPAGEKIVIKINLQLDWDAGAQFQGRNTHFDLSIGSDEISLKHLKPLPALHGLPTFPPLPTLPPLRAL